MNSQIEAWKQQILEETGSSTFCILPWIHLAISPNGKSKLCCIANTHLTDDPITSIFELWNSEEMRSIRLQFLTNQMPDSCTRCFTEESNNIVSKRIWEIGKWKELIDLPQVINDTSSTGQVAEKISYLDLRLENTCNLKCIMCGPDDSSKWVTEYQKLYPLIANKNLKSKLEWNNTYRQWHKDETVWSELLDQIPNLKVVYFAGGEPLIIKKHKEFILKIIELGFENQIELRYNTNGLFVDDDIINLWLKFKSVQISVSLDDIEERNHYIRYPSNWNTIVKNLYKLDNTASNIQIYIATSIQLLNVRYLPEFAKWLISQNFKKIQMAGMVNTHYVYTPTFLNIQCLPQSDKEEIKLKFLDFKKWLYDQNIDYSKWNRFDDIIEFMMLKDSSNELKYFQEYITHLDSIRHTDFKKIFPELGHLLNV